MIYQICKQSMMVRLHQAISNTHLMVRFQTQTSIRGTGDTTTPTLFEVGSMNDFTVNVLQHVFNGVQLYPGKNNIVDRQKPTSFFSHEKKFFAC